MAKNFVDSNGNSIEVDLGVDSTTPGLMSNTDKTKLDGIETGATKTVVDTAMSSTSTNTVQNKVINTAIGAKANTTDLNTHISNKSNPHEVTLAQVGGAAVTHYHAATDITSGTLPITRGGTGLTAAPSLLTNLATTTAASVFAASPRPGVTGTLPVANGGTGLTAAPSMLVNLASTTAASILAASPRPGVTGTLPIANGGTGTTTVAGILSALGLSNFGDACCARGNTTTGTLPKTTITKIPLTTFAINTNTSAFEISNGGIKVNKAGTILITGNAYINLTADPTADGCYVYKGTTEIASQFITQYTSGAMSSGTRIVSVAAGDIFYLYGRSYVETTFNSSVESTNLNIVFIA